MAPSKRNRIPKLSGRPEPGKGKYYAAYRGPNGKPKRKRFSKDRKESERLYRRWVVANYDPDVRIVLGHRAAYKGGLPRSDAQQSLPYVANALIQHEKGRVREDGGRRARGTISLRAFEDNRKQVDNILDWCEQRFGPERLRHESLATLVTETDYEAMMVTFSKRFSTSQVNKHRQRFWAIVRMGRRRPFEIRFPFGPEDVQLFGGTETRKERDIPTVAMIRKLLAKASDRERLWIWMGLGLGFGNDDLARSRRCNFDEDSYDMRRGKTGVERYGEMCPMVWAHLQRYLEKNPREPGELLFVTGNGLPVVWQRAKTADEMQNGTTTRKPTVTPYKRCDTVWQAFRRLKNRAGLEDWNGTFYLWRHLGATAYGAREGVGINQVRTFLGHGKSDVADAYMKPLKPAVKKLVEWVNEMLDADDLDAWRED